MFSRFALFILFCIPSFSQAAVLVNEVAWMGTFVGANEEWIELSNTSDDSVSLDGWTLSDGVSLTITLAGTIGAHAYALLERTDDETVPTVPAFHVYTGALANDGRTLTLRRADGTLEDTVIGGTDWTNIGGDNVTKDTPQRTASGWITAVPTPGKVNSTKSTATDTADEDTNDTVGTVLGATASRASGSGERVSLEAPTTDALVLTLDAPITAYVNQTVPLQVTASGLGKTLTASLVYAWNFGDGETGMGDEVTHQYAYPGEYAVVAYASYGTHEAAVRTRIRVLPVSLTLTRTDRGDIVISNTTHEEIDVSGFTLSDTSQFVFPERSFILANGNVTIRRSEVGVGMVTLADTAQVAVATYPAPPSSTYAVTPRAVTRERAESVSKAEESAENARVSVKETEETDTSAPNVPIEGLTIPLYANAAGTEGGVADVRTSTAPYAGLLVIIVLGILALYIRRGEHG